MYEYSTLIEIGDDAVEAALTVMLGDLLRSGVTTFVDIAGPHACWLPVLAGSGARAYVAPGFREAAWHVEGSHRLDFRWDAARGRDAFARAMETVDAARAHPSGRLGGIVAPAQVKTCSPDLLQAAAEAARSRGVPITVHAAQTMAEHEELVRRHGLTAVAYLESLGLLGPHLIRRAFKAGVVDFLTKPIDEQVLVEALQQASGALDVHAERAEAAKLVAQLTDREREVLDMVGRGWSTKEIAEALQLSPRTVDTHRGNIAQKLGTTSVAEFARLSLIGQTP